MKRQTILLLVLILLHSCVKSQISVNDLMGPPWIPKKQNWKDGSFETLYFYTNSNFIKIASTQVLTDKDSISFMSEPGFVLYNGKYNIVEGKNEIILQYRLVYRTFVLTGEKLPGDHIIEKISIRRAGNDKIIRKGGTSYIHTQKFTNESIQKLTDVVQKFLPSVLK